MGDGPHHDVIVGLSSNISSDAPKLVDEDITQLVSISVFLSFKLTNRLLETSSILTQCYHEREKKERRRINRQQNLLRRYPDINVKDIFKGCIRCEKFCQQVTDYSNCVTADSFMPSPNAYPVVRQINGNQSMPSVNLQMPSTQPPPNKLVNGFLNSIQTSCE
ncbi:doublesex- and mab-3-related transcription factor 1-like [Octopus vulgaris]|uniref:Doublesex- and mab-3-related transcription factor 1-like n=1 Tax=Octopus vulgaris TaxID=6645 RepID=A0AA36BPF3_OCTVU|nr:doublesex- and mab-3-related transcription factor 1-like [Octopus vulgaris]